MDSSLKNQGFYPVGISGEMRVVDSSLKNQGFYPVGISGEMSVWGKFYK